MTSTSAWSSAELVGDPGGLFAIASRAEHRGSTNSSCAPHRVASLQPEGLARLGDEGVPPPGVGLRLLEALPCIQGAGTHCLAFNVLAPIRLSCRPPGSITRSLETRSASQQQNHLCLGIRLPAAWCPHSAARTPGFSHSRSPESADSKTPASPRLRDGLQGSNGRTRQMEKCSRASSLSFRQRRFRITCH